MERSSFEIGTELVIKEKSLQESINSLSTIEQEILLISRQIIDLQGKKKDFEYQRSKAHQNKQLLNSEIRVLTHQFFATKNQGL